MRGEINILEWQRNFAQGLYEVNDFNIQVKAGWYDWFCDLSHLAVATKKFGKIISKLKAGGKVDLESNYVWFKNNCPVNYPLYDDFRIADMKNFDVQFTIECGHPFGNQFNYVVYARRIGFGVPAFRCKTIKQLVNWLNTPWEKLSFKQHEFFSPDHEGVYGVKEHGSRLALDLTEEASDIFQSYSERSSLNIYADGTIIVTKMEYNKKAEEYQEDCDIPELNKCPDLIKELNEYFSENPLYEDGKIIKNLDELIDFLKSYN